MVLSAVLVALIAMLPLLFVVSETIRTGWDEAWALIVRPRVGTLLSNTVRLIIGAVLLSVIIGTMGAWLVERTNIPLRKMWNVLLVAPLAIPAFVNGFGWVSWTANVEGYAGAVLIVTLSYFPFVYLPVAATLRGLDPALEETSQTLGNSSWQTFLRVVLPQLYPALLGGSLLVGLHLLAEFGALQMLRFPTFTTAIYDQYSSSFNGPAANMLASVLVFLCLFLLLVEIKVRGNRRYSRVGSGAARHAERQQLGRLTPVCLVALGLVVALALGVPVVSMLHWLVVGTSSSFPFDSLVSTAMTSIGLGLVAALLTTAAAFPLVWLSVRRRGLLTTTLERSAFVSTALPGIVIALALVTVAIRWAQPIYQTTVLLVVAYGIMFLPRALVSVRAALVHAPPTLDDVAHSLGAGAWDTFRRVTVPIIAPGLGAGAALVFLAVTTELTATLLLAPIETRTLATQFWSNSSAVAYGAAAPYALLMVLISLPATYLLTREAKISSQS